MARLAGFRVVTSRRAYRGRIISVQVDRVRYPSGRIHLREIITHPGAVVVAPRLGEDRWLLVRQYRHTARRTFWEFPAGKLDRGENPRQAARRELAEEIGYRPRRLEHVASFYPSPGVFAERMHFFIAGGLVKKSASLDDDEIMAVRAVRLSELKRMAQSSQVQDGKTLLAIYYLLAHRKQVL